MTTRGRASPSCCAGDRGARCSHASGSLDQGWILGDTLACPWHGSRCDVRTGQPTAGPTTCPQRRDLMLTLASELDIHEHIEDKIFYPAVEPVSEGAQVAHSEHMTLADLLAMTLRLGTSTRAFDKHLKALHAAFNHHAGSAEQSMFHEAQRLGDARLRGLGQPLEMLLDHERTSPFRRAFHELKIGLLEKV